VWVNLLFIIASQCLLCVSHSERPPRPPTGRPRASGKLHERSKTFVTYTAFAKREPTQVNPERAHRAFPRPTNPKWLRTCFFIFRMAFAVARKEKKMMASRKLWCAWRQLGQIVLRRAFAQPDAHAKQITARRAGSCIAFKSHGGKRVSRLHVYRVVIRQDRLLSFLNNWMQLLTSSTQGSPGRQCRSSPRSS